MSGKSKNLFITALLGSMVFGGPVFAKKIITQQFEFYAKAVEAERLGNFKEAATNYLLAHEVNKQDPDALIKLATLHLHSDASDAETRNKSLEQAIDYLQSANRLRPQDAMINVLLAQAFEQVGKINNAVRHYSKAVTLEPGNVLLHLNLGLIYFEQKEFKPAIENLNKVVMAYPENLRARSYLGAALQSTENYLAAIEQYKQVLDYDAEQYSIVKNLGDCWLALDQLEKARTTYKLAQHLDPNVPDIYADLAVIDSKESKHKEAIANYEKALELKESDAWKRSMAYSLWANKDMDEAAGIFAEVEDYGVAAYLYQLTGSIEDSVRVYKKAIEKNPNDIKSAYNLARIYHERGDLELAKDHYLAVMKQKPNDVEVLFLLGLVEHELGSYGNAIKYYDELVAQYLAEDSIEVSQKKLREVNLDEMKTKVHYNLGLAYKSQDDLESAEHNFEQVQESARKQGFERQSDLYRELSFIKIALGKNGEAEKIISNWLKENPTNVEARNLYADFLIQSSRERRAVEQLRLASVLDNTNQTRLKLANLLHSQNNLYEALAEFQTVLREEPDNLNAILGAANNFKALGLREEALDMYKQALEYKPDDLLANYNYGLLLQETGEHTEALQRYLKVQALNPNYIENYYVLGLAYWELGDKATAINTWQGFLGKSTDDSLKDEVNQMIEDYRISLEQDIQQEKPEVENADAASPEPQQKLEEQIEEVIDGEKPAALNVEQLQSDGLV